MHVGITLLNTKILHSILSQATDGYKELNKYEADELFSDTLMTCSSFQR